MFNPTEHSPAVEKQRYEDPNHTTLDPTIQNHLVETCVLNKFDEQARRHTNPDKSG
jgi:hypothetical protein